MLQANHYKSNYIKGTIFCTKLGRGHKLE